MIGITSLVVEFSGKRYIDWLLFNVQRAVCSYIHDDSWKHP